MGGCEMLEEQYRELNELRTYLKSKQKQRLANKLQIRKLQKEITATRSERMDKLKDKRQFMIMDKELRSLHEITNQKDWTVKVRELTREEEDKISSDIQALEEQVEELSDELDTIRIRIEDTRWELTIKTEYYSHSPEQLGDLTTQIKEMI